MAKKKLARLSQRILTKDRQIAQAVLGLQDYTPANKDFTADRLREALGKLEEAEAAEAAAQEAAARAREEAMRIEAEFHELILGTKRQVIAQYGDDSDEISALGMKKKSERRYGRPRKSDSDES